MARNYANVSTAIWRDGDFRKLTGAAQRMYLLAISQADISAAGVLALRLPRWAATAVDTSPADLQRAVDELQASRHVVYDEINGELLVRSFVRWDGGYGNPKRRPVIIRAVLEVETPEIRCAVVVELERLGIDVGAELRRMKIREALCPRHPAGHGNTHADTHADSLSGSHSDAIPGEQAVRSEQAPADRDVCAVSKQSEQMDLAFPQVNSLSGCLPDTHADGITPSEGVVVTKGPYIEPTTHNPQPTTHNPVPPPAGAPTSRRRTTREPPSDNAAAVVAAYIDGAVAAGHGRPRGSLPGRVGRDARQLLGDGVPPSDLLVAASEMGRAGWHDLAVQLQRSSASRASPGNGHRPYTDPTDMSIYEGPIKA